MDKFFEILKNNSIETRLRVSNSTFIVELLSELGLEHDREINEKIAYFTEIHTKNQLELIEEWKNDGEPK